jgi:SRSO17 transposase
VTASRKNAWQVAEALGEATPYAIQHVLNRAKWDCDGARDELRASVKETLASPHAVIVIDETSFLKKGSKSVGVQRQYSGTAGRIENCQIGVFLAYASVRGHALLDRELYLPKSWADDQQRCQEAHVPEGVTFATKPELAWRMLERTLDTDLPVAWVTGDTVYGSAQSLRTTLEARRRAYALAVTCKERVHVQGRRSRVDQLAHDLTEEDWQELSAGAGSKGLRLFAWARIELATPAISGWQRWLVVRRSLEEGGKPADKAYILVFAPAGTSLQEMGEAFGKNALDWASRPFGHSVLAGKLTAITGAGGRGGTAQAQAHLRLILKRFGVAVLDQPEVYIANSWETFDPDGHLQDEASREQLRALLTVLLAAVYTQAAVVAA